MNKSESIAKLADALCKAQSQMKGAVKDSLNPHFKNKYADLASVWDACREPLTKNGLSVVQIPEGKDGKVVVVTVLMHTSGEWISGDLEMKPIKDDPQGVCSAITYGRRYGLSAFAGISPEDDDGNAASGNGYVQGRVNGGKPVERIEQDIQLDRGETAQPPADQLVTIEQAKKLHMRFKEELSDDLKPQSEALLHDFLGRKLIMDAHGNPSAKAVRKDEYLALGKEIVALAKTLSAVPA